MKPQRDEKQNNPEARHCEVCGTELTEKQASVGVRVCGQSCAGELDRRSGISLEQFYSDLRADAPTTFPADELSPAAVRLLQRHPKLAEFLEAMDAEDAADPTLILTRFITALEDGDIVANTPAAKNDLMRITGWFRKRLEANNQEETMDRIMGLRRPGLHPPAIEGTVQRFDDEYLFSEMIILRSMLGATIPEAAEMVSRLHKEAGADADPAGEIEGRYRRSLFGRREFSAELVKIFEELEPMTREDRDEYLKQFPWVPERLRKFIFPPASKR